VCLPNAGQLSKLAKDEANSVLDTLIRIDYQSSVRSFEISRTDHQMQLATLSFFPDRCLRAFVQNSKLNLAELSL